MKSIEFQNPGFIPLTPEGHVINGAGLLSILSNGWKVVGLIGLIELVVDVTAGIIEGYNYGSPLGI